MSLSPLETSALARDNYQGKALKEHVLYLQTHSSYYKQALKWGGPLNDDFKELLKQLPFTEKDDLARDNESFLCVDSGDLRDIVTTSGTLGDPVAVYLTEKDLKRLAKNEADSYRIAGCSEKDRFQLLTTIDKRFMAGLAYFLGVREIGGCIIRSGPGALRLQWESIKLFKPTVLIAVPSFIPQLIAYANQNGIDIRTTSVKKIICIGEPIRDADLKPNYLAQRITNDWDVQLFSTYASTEMGTAFTECEHGNGAHVQPELMILEVLNEDGVQVLNGEKGEVVVTPLEIEGSPILRFRTGDVCHYYDEPCACGRNTPRLGPVVGRKQQLIKFKGTSLYPNAIIDELNAMKEVVNFVIELESNEMGLDEVILRVALRGENAEKKVKDRLADKLRVKPRVILSDKEAINKIKFNDNDRKPKILIDNRQ
ncbi:phenylacetate--CoA ligase family protein [Bacteroidota bacterium]